jgi:hypothetical protein
MTTKETVERLKKLIKIAGKGRVDLGKYALVTFEDEGGVIHYFIGIRGERLIIFDTSGEGWLEGTTPEQKAAAIAAIDRALVLDDLADI